MNSVAPEEPTMMSPTLLFSQRQDSTTNSTVLHPSASTQPPTTSNIAVAAATPAVSPPLTGFIIKSKKHRESSASYLQRVFRGHMIRSQANRVVSINDCISAIDSIERALYGYWVLGIALILMFLFIAVLIDQRGDGDVYAQISALQDYINMLPAPMNGRSICPALRAALDEYMLVCFIPSLAGDVASSIQAINLTQVCPGIDLYPTVTLAQINTMSLVYDWIDAFVIAASDNSADWNIAMPKAEADSRILQQNRLFNGILATYSRSELGSCNGNRTALYPRCRRDDLPPITTPYSTPQVNASIVPAFLTGACPPFYYYTTFNRYPLFFASEMSISGASFVYLRALEYSRTYNSIDMQTKDVQILFLLYNGNNQLVTPVRITFSFSLVGAVTSNVEIRPVRDQTYAYFASPIWITYLIFLSYSTIAKLSWTIRKIRERNRRILKHWSTKVDFTCYALLWAGVVLWTLHVHRMSSLVLEPVTLNISDSSDGVNAIVSGVLFVLSEAAALDTYFLLQAIALFFCLLRLLGLLQFQPQLALVTDTLVNAGEELVQFLFVYLCMIVLLAPLGYILFGDLESFSTFSNALLTLFSWNFGGFSTDDIYAISPIIGPIYFFVFIIFMYLLMLNVFLAIILEGYNGVRKVIQIRSASTPSQIRLFRQLITRSLKSFWSQIRGGKKTMSRPSEVRAALIKIAEKTGKTRFTLLMLQAYLKKEGLPPEAAEYWVRIQLRFGSRKRIYRDAKVMARATIDLQERTLDLITKMAEHSGIKMQPRKPASISNVVVDANPKPFESFGRSSTSLIPRYPFEVEVES